MGCGDLPRNVLLAVEPGPDRGDGHTALGVAVELAAHDQVMDALPGDARHRTCDWVRHRVGPRMPHPPPWSEDRSADAPGSSARAVTSNTPLNYLTINAKCLMPAVKYRCRLVRAGDAAAGETEAPTRISVVVWLRRGPTGRRLRGRCPSARCRAGTGWAGSAWCRSPSPGWPGRGGPGGGQVGTLGSFVRESPAAALERGELTDAVVVDDARRSNTKVSASLRCGHEDDQAFSPVSGLTRC